MLFPPPFQKWVRSRRLRTSGTAACASGRPVNPLSPAHSHRHPPWPSAGREIGKANSQLPSRTEPLSTPDTLAWNCPALLKLELSRSTSLLCPAPAGYLTFSASSAKKKKPQPYPIPPLLPPPPSPGRPSLFPLRSDALLLQEKSAKWPENRNLGRSNSARGRTESRSSARQRNISKPSSLKRREGKAQEHGDTVASEPPIRTLQAGETIPG